MCQMNKKINSLIIFFSCNYYSIYKVKKKAPLWELLLKKLIIIYYVRSTDRVSFVLPNLSTFMTSISNTNIINVKMSKIL